MILRHAVKKMPHSFHGLAHEKSSSHVPLLLIIVCLFMNSNCSCGLSPICEGQEMTLEPRDWISNYLRLILVFQAVSHRFVSRLSWLCKSINSFLVWRWYDHLTTFKKQRRGFQQIEKVYSLWDYSLGFLFQPRSDWLTYFPHGYDLFCCKSTLSPDFKHSWADCVRTLLQTRSHHFGTEPTFTLYIIWAKLRIFSLLYPDGF